ncbi:helix-turn-helix transcriptional regulator [Staphylococcus sp. GDY8P72P]|uniref:helix-turn-helix domain-containing protein n=1 Tax=Staphylococcus sp. GDY8P72P TaxID=2804425 RepID=UPI00194E8CEF|nr:helix-turn-helix transcriptional regulator [Staphylococcus sp. GDY8P72P]
MIKTNIPELRYLIAKNGHSLRSFSKISGISLSYLSLIVNNKVTPSPKMAKKLSENLNVNIEYLFDFEIKEEER